MIALWGFWWAIQTEEDDDGLGWEAILVHKSASAALKSLKVKKWDFQKAEKQKLSDIS